MIGLVDADNKRDAVQTGYGDAPMTTQLLHGLCHWNAHNKGAATGATITKELQIFL